MNKDLEHLKLLGLFHYIVGGLLALFACIPFIHLVIGLVLVFTPEAMKSNGQSPPRVIGWVFVCIASGLIFVGWAAAFLVVWAGRCLRQSRHYTFCFVMACVASAFMPFGTVLGVLTLIALSRPEIKVLFTPTSLPGR